MKYGVILCSLFLCGCEKFLPLPLTSNLSSTKQNSPTGAINVLGMGQSNMEKMSPEGARVFLTQMLPRPVSFVNCAVGGTPITQWMPGTPYFEGCMAKFQHVDAVLWSQGEAETQNDGDGLGDLHNASNWAYMFTTIAREVQRRNPGCKIVYVQIAKDPAPFTSRYPGWEIVKSQQEAISLTDVKKITADDLENNAEDHIHFTTFSYQMLGGRYAEALKQLLAG